MDTLLKMLAENDRLKADAEAEKLFRKERAGPTEGAVADLINGVLLKFVGE